MEKSFELRREWMEEQQPFACWLHGAAGNGGKWKEKLLVTLGTPQEVYRADKETLEKLVGAERAARLCAARGKDVRKAYEDMQNCGIVFYPFYHPEYPKRLLDIPDRPFGVYVKGKIRDDGPRVAVVGARDCSPYGSYVAETFARGLAEMGLLVVSGMARGIDGIAQKAALDANGSTCAVLGCGVDICYPASNEALYREICSNGVVLSEYPPRHEATALVVSAAKQNHKRACRCGAGRGGAQKERNINHGGHGIGAGKRGLCHTGKNHRQTERWVQQSTLAGRHDRIVPRTGGRGNPDDLGAEQVAEKG